MSVDGALEPGVRHLGLSTTLRVDSETFVAAADMCGRRSQAVSGAKLSSREARDHNEGAHGGNRVSPVKASSGAERRC